LAINVKKEMAGRSFFIFFILDLAWFVVPKDISVTNQCHQGLITAINE